MNKKTRMGVLFGLVILLIGAVAFIYWPAPPEPLPEEIPAADAGAPAGAPRPAGAKAPAEPERNPVRADEDPTAVPG